MTPAKKILLVGIGAENQAIGFNGKLPWENEPNDNKVMKGDLKKFKDRTTDFVVIMGSKTALSIGKPLPNRINIIITRNKETFLANPLWDKTTNAKNVYCYNSIKEAIEDFEYQYAKIFIIGGAQIYKLALEENLVDEIIASETYDRFEGDTFFPEIFHKDKWKQEILADHPEEGYRYKEVRYY